MNTNHGSPYDRGGADSWYRRGYNPHWFPEGTGRGKLIIEQDMSPQEIKEYKAGYEEGESSGDHKEW